MNRVYRFESCPFACLLSWFVFAVAVGWCASSQAQWTTQMNSLKPGWNAVYMHVDASHTDLDDLILGDPGNPIDEIWYWRPALPTGQFTESPEIPSADGSQWFTWKRNGTNTIDRLVGNGAYLIRVGSGVTTYSWAVRGQPVIPTYRWTLTGLNFIGFPVVTTPQPPTFHSFLSQNTELLNNFEVYRYQGGELGATNPVRMLDKNTRRMDRTQAYWVRAGETYNQYFGPIQLVGVNDYGVRFGQKGGQASFRLRNLANQPITVTLTHMLSENDPDGNAVPAPTLLLRGDLNTEDLTFGFSELETGSGATRPSWNLAAAGAVGSEVEVVIGLDRSSMSGVPGTAYASVLRFTDSLNLSQLDMAVSAETSSRAGLWVGAAAVTNVNHQFKHYAKATNAVAMTNLLVSYNRGQGVNGYRYEHEPNTGQILVFGGPDTNNPAKGAYLLDQTDPANNLPGGVPRPFPLRLIVHHSGTTAQLLQRVYYGLDKDTSNAVLTLNEARLLPSKLSEARRISSVHLPLKTAAPFVTESANRMTATVGLSFDNDASNPFLHTYHPDHDNLDAQFSSMRLDRGIESYDVIRRITLQFAAPENDFNGLTQGSLDLAGSYDEEIVILGQGGRTNNVSGAFHLKKISDIDTLTP